MGRDIIGASFSEFHTYEVCQPCLHVWLYADISHSARAAMAAPLFEPSRPHLLHNIVAKHQLTLNHACSYIDLEQLASY